MHRMRHNILQTTSSMSTRGLCVSGLNTTWRNFSDAVKLGRAESQSLERWTASPPEHTPVDCLRSEHLADLYVTLPSRDGTRRPYEAPEVGITLPYGHHLAFFHARRPEALLRADGTDEDISPPPPFTKRMWAGGKMTWNNKNPLLVGKATQAISTVAKAEKKGFDKGKPMVFVTQKIEFTQVLGQRSPCLVEERSHVYFHAEAFANKKKTFDKEVKDIPIAADFSFRYTPTPVTLFRYSALMFNAHHIHLDKEYCQKEGYPERLVHGPLTAQMLLETVNFHFPKLNFHKFEYRATNPLFVNCELTISGKRLDESNILVWCSDANGVVGMTGKVEVQ